MIVQVLITIILTSWCSLVASADVCDLCVCLYHTGDHDYAGEQIDCSYKSQDILKTENSLPSIVHSLDLSSSNISSLEESNLLSSKSLIELYLNNNRIVNIDTSALALPELKILDLSNNRLEYIDKEAFRSLKKLENLNLANNLFATASNLAFHRLSSLNEIVLDYNNIGPSLLEINLFARSGVGLTSKIRSISIRAINLTNVPYNFFSEAYDIRSLTISGNKLEDTFELPPTLEYLDLSDNPIKEISEEDFSDVPGLRELRLNNLAISEVPDFTFAPLHGLKDLKLERNKNLTKFSRLAFGQDVLEDADDFLLERLSLRGSRLTRLDKALAVPFGQLFQLDLQGNPWICDCNILWVKSLQILPKDYDHFRCALPKPLYNARIFELKDKYFRCPPPRHHIGLLIAVVTFCVTSTAIVIWLFMFLPKTNHMKYLYNPYATYTVLSMPNN